ncbi:hypothetical protein [Ekhidna sp. To15]|uniref:hypothetical protein n=1 Tax=Ekhidna sp. To15 TaxID=3395267 RepID=UPI003F51E8EE
MKRFFFMAIVVAIITPCYSQTMPSASSLSTVKGINLPVNKYNGTASVSVPLYTAPLLKGGGINVGLSYTTSGIKVNEASGPVGLGWQLIAGGKITRVMMGHPDEYSDFNTSKTVDNLANVHYGYQDTEKDIFYFEYPGGGGRFIFGDGFYTACNPTDCTLQCDSQACLEAYNDCVRASNRSCSGGEITFDQIHTLPGSDMHISFHYTDKLNSYFVITDMYGNQYTFGNGLNSSGNPDAQEVTISERSNLNQSGYDPSLREEYISTWHLTEIDHAGLSDSHNTIFTYGNSESTEVVEEGAETQFNAVDVANPNILGVVDQQVTQTKTTTQVRRLTEIETSMAKITFEYGDRNDVNGGKKVTAISLLDGIGNEVSKTEFEYLNSNAASSYKYDQIYSSPPPSESLYRLMLKTITKDGLPIRQFKYKNEESDLFQLPPRGSYYTDHWGYYNGGTQHGGTYLPYPDLEEEEYVLDKGILKLVTLVLPGMDKSSSPAAKANILTEVSYPSGGYTKFRYGIHPNGGGVRVSRIEQYNEHGVMVNGSEYEYFDEDTDNFIRGPIPRYLKFMERSEHTMYVPGEVEIGGVIVDVEVPVVEDRYKFILFPSAESLTFDLNGPSHGYKRVKVTNQLTDAHTIHHFTEFDEEVAPTKKQFTVDILIDGIDQSGIDANQSPFSSTDLNYFNRGLENKTEVFDESGDLVSTIVTNYEHTGPQYMTKSMKVEFLRNNPLEYFFDLITGTNFSLLTSEYDIEVKTLRLAGTVVTTNDQDGEVTETKTFDYASNHPSLPVEVNTELSTGHFTKKLISYPFSDHTDVISKFEDQSVLTQMVNDGMIGIPTMEENKIKYPNDNSYKTSGVRLTTFKSFGSKRLPHQSYALAIESPGAWIADDLILTSTNDYKSSGQLKSKIGRSEIETRYDYNADGYLSSVTADNGVEQQTTNYIYESLVGVSSVQGPDGRSVSYEYDELNRLYLIRDQDQNIIKRYRYNYAGDIVKSSNYGDISATLTVSFPRLAGTPIYFNASDIIMFGSASMWWSIEGTNYFDDGTSVSHTFNTSGEYSPSFTIDNPEYAQPKIFNALNITVYNDYWKLNPMDGPGQTCTYPDAQIDPNQETEFDDLTYSISTIAGTYDCAGAAPIEFEWTYDKGNGPVVFGTGYEATLPNVIHDVPGTATIKVTATDQCGQVEFATKTLTINVWSESCSGGTSGPGDDDDNGDGDGGGGPANPWGVVITGNGNQSICPNSEEPSSFTFGSQIDEGDHTCGTTSYTYTWDYEVNGQSYSLGGGVTKTISRSTLLTNGTINDTYVITLTVSDGCGETKTYTTNLTFKLNC